MESLKGRAEKRVILKKNRSFAHVFLLHYFGRYVTIIKEYKRDKPPFYTVMILSSCLWQVFL